MRIVLKEVTPKRILEAISRRIGDIPDAMIWNFSEVSKVNNINLNSFRNIHKGDRCFIIANGPSLNKIDLSALRHEYTFSMNRAYLLYDTWGFTPSYYVCINELVLEQFFDDIKDLNMPKFLNFNRRELYGYSNDTMYLRTSYNFSDHFCRDVTKPISSGGTVTFACLQLAYFMGFSEVILVGLDHDFVEKGVPSQTVTRTEDRDESHCHPGYFPKGFKWQLPDLFRSELAYRLAREAFEVDGRKIVDATSGGRCHVFEKIEYNSVVTGV